MMFRVLTSVLLGLSFALAQQTPPEPALAPIPPPAAPEQTAAPAPAAAAPAECAAMTGNQFGSLLCSAKTRLAEWEKVDRDLTPQLEKFCDRQRVNRIVKQLQDARRAADEAMTTYFQEYEQFIDEQIEGLRHGKAEIDTDYNRKIAKTNNDLDQSQKLLDQKRKELETIPTDATPAYIDSLKSVIKALDQQVGHLRDTVQALKDTLDKRAYIDKEWDNQKIVAHTNLTDVTANGESFVARYANLMEAQLTKCAAGVTNSSPQQDKP
jgi:exonuclease VII large subunit